jgi:isopentenyl-diphosphate delta-isomerase
LLQVILVDEQDAEVGKMGKMEAHQKGLLHRAFSIFILNDKGQMLLQQRTLSKYHSGGLWTNACCSHPQPGETILEAANKRLQEEMGFTTELTEAFSFVYNAKFNNGLTEYEFDHVLIGKYNSPIAPNESEVKDYCFLSINQINAALQITPQKYTAWFKIAFPKLVEYLANTTK